MDGIETHAPLTAETLGGRRMSVKLTGENLHYNDNSIYWSKKRSEKFLQVLATDSPRSKSPSPNKTCHRLSSIDSFDADDVACKIHDEVETYRQKIPPGQGIGFLGMFAESDYQWVCLCLISVCAHAYIVH